MEGVSEREGEGERRKREGERGEGEIGVYKREGGRERRGGGREMGLAVTLSLILGILSVANLRGLL